MKLKLSNQNLKNNNFFTCSRFIFKGKKIQADTEIKITSSRSNNFTLKECSEKIIKVNFFLK